MADGNGNGNTPILDINVMDDHAFRTGVVQHLQRISDNTNDLPVIRRTVRQHEQIVKTGKWLGIPFMIALQGFIKHLLKW